METYHVVKFSINNSYYLCVSDKIEDTEDLLEKYENDFGDESINNLIIGTVKANSYRLALDELLNENVNAY